jgi:plasmid stabilization system protein ParE
VRLVFAPEAEEDVDRIDTWWRENRRDAPRLFAEELAYARDQILRNPLIYKPYCERNGVTIRRWLMRRTEQHVYYEVDLEHDLVIVLRVWGARRKYGPKL